MPDLGELIAGAVRFIGDTLGASRLQVGVAATLALLAIVLVLLYLLARPGGRWTARDLGRLQSISRTMALAAESGATAAFSLGTAGLARPASATDRMQTWAALAVLAEVARAAARSGVPLEVTANDALAVEMGRVVLADAFAETATGERARRAAVRHVGEGRPSPAGHALGRRVAAGSTAHVVGGLAEEAVLVFTGELRGSAADAIGTATASQAPYVVLMGGGTLIGPEVYAAATVTAGRAVSERAAAFSVNRLIWAAVAALLIGALLSATGLVEPASFIAAPG